MCISICSRSVYMCNASSESELFLLGRSYICCVCCTYVSRHVSVHVRVCTLMCVCTRVIKYSCIIPVQRADSESRATISLALALPDRVPATEVYGFPLIRNTFLAQDLILKPGCPRARHPRPSPLLPPRLPRSSYIRYFFFVFASSGTPSFIERSVVMARGIPSRANQETGNAVALCRTRGD